MKSFLNFIFIFSFLFCMVFVLGNFFAKADSIGFDVLNSSGGRMTGGDYILESSLGQATVFSASGGDYVLNSGFQQNFDTGTYIAVDISFPSGESVVMSDISGFISGDIGDGYTDVDVVTDYSGYSLSIKSENEPALKCDISSGCSASDSFDDYVPVGGKGAPDYDWVIAANESLFGFTPKGDHILSKYKYDSINELCGSGLSGFTGDYCWDGLSTSYSNMAYSSGSNHPEGTVTRVKFRSQVGTEKTQPSGDYEASVVVTATANQ